MSGQRSGFASNAFHSTAITEEAESAVANQFVVRLVEDAGSVCLGNSKAHRISKALAQGTSSDFNTRCFMSLRVAGGFTVQLLTT